MNRRVINSIDPIVPDRDDQIGRSGGARPVARKERPDERKSAPKNTAGSGGSGKVLGVVALVALIAVAAVGWMQFQQLDQKHTNLQQRFGALEAKLTSTDESMSQSGAALQMRINEQKEQLETHWSEIKKLWGVANDINKKKIAANDKDIAFLTSKRAEMEKTLASLKSQIDKDGKALSNVSASYLAMTADFEALNGQLRDMNDTIKRLQTALNKAEKQNQSTADAIQSFDAYRRQINQKIYQLEQSLPKAGVQ